ncbi:MAG TPA: N-acetyltransferase [Rugosimonospora sp.]|nr:N-acetyltransferase [Rugosimonospora sp.]
MTATGTARVPGTATIVSLADRPDLAAAVPGVLASRWPAYLLEGRPGHDADLIGLLLDAAEHQVVLVDAADRVLAVGLSVPLDWDGTVAGLPAGWDGAVDRAARLVAQGGTPDAVCALSITIVPEAAGQGLAAPMVQALKQAAVRIGAGALIAPVRPIRKAEFPLVPMQEYVEWRTRSGDVFDPWLRLHLRLGARQLGIAASSMTVTGTVANWERWTGLPLHRSGLHVIPGGLVPLLVDERTGAGWYHEPNVWVAHPCRNDPPGYDPAFAGRSNR